MESISPFAWTFGGILTNRWMGISKLAMIVRPITGSPSSGTLRLVLAIEPFLDERSPQCSVRGMGPSMSEKNCAYGVFLVCGHDFAFVGGMRIRFGGSEKTCPHHDAISAQAERSRETSSVSDPACDQD